MVRQIIELLLGEVGRKILFFYEANALIINVIVLSYGLLVLMSWLNLTRIYRHLVVELAKGIHLSTKVDKSSSPKKILAAVKIDWKDAVEKANFPLIAGQTGLYPVRKSVENIRILINEDELVVNAIEVLNGANPRKIMPSFRKMVEKRESLRNRK